MAESRDPSKNGVSENLNSACVEHKAGATNILRMVEDLRREKNEALRKIRRLENQLLVRDIFQKHENEKSSKRILDLETKLDAWKKVEEVKRKFVSKKQVKERDIAVDVDTVRMLERQLEEKQEEIADLQDFNQALIVKERQVNNELQEARNLLILEFPFTYSDIRIKRLGEIQKKPFRDACNDRFPIEEAELRATELYSLWEERLKDSSWHPLKVVNIHGIPQEVIDEDDEKLRNLKDEWGDDIQEAVISAYKELNEYNPSGRYPVGEVWNFNHDRKAPLKEVVSYLLKALRTQKRKRQQF